MTSNSVTVSGIDAAAAISVSGGSYSVNNGTFTITPGLVNNGDTVKVRHTSSANYATKVNTTLAMGGVSATFSSTTEAEPEDTTPSAFSFTAQTSVERSSTVTSNSITVGGINTPAAISVVGGSYSINGGTFTNTAGTVTNGATVRVQHTSAAAYATKVDTVLTIGGVEGIFSSTTLTEPTVMVFLEQNDVRPSTVIESNTITVSGLTVPVTLSVSGGEYSKNGGAYTKTTGTVQNGDTLRVRHTSSSKSKTTVTTTLKLGTKALPFKSTTLVIDVVPDAFSFTALTDVAPSTSQESDAIRITGMNSASAVSVSGGEYRINGGIYTKTAGKVNAGDMVQVRHTSSGQSSKEVKTTLTVGGVKGVFTSKTLLFDIAPDAFSFATKAGVAKSTLVESDSITISGINVPVAVSATGGEYRLNGGTYTKAKGTVKAGDKLQLRHLSSSKANKTVSTKVTVGSSRVEFKSTTQ